MRIIILLFVFSLCFAKTETNPQKVLVLAGPSGFGKSSFINLFSQNPNMAVISDNRGWAQTRFVQPYSITRNSIDFAVFDVPGFWDAQQELTNEEINLRIMDSMLKCQMCRSISAILLFESLSEAKSNLYRSITELQSLFGSSFKKSLIVIFTKANLVSDKEMLDERKEEMEILCKSMKIPFIYWEDSKSKTFTQEKDVAQTNELIELINKLPSYNNKELIKIQKAVYERAIDLMIENKDLSKSIIRRTDDKILYTKVEIIKKSPVVKIASAAALWALGGILAPFAPALVPVIGLATKVGSVAIGASGMLDVYLNDDKRIREIWTTEEDLAPFLNIAKSEIYKKIRDEYSNTINFVDDL